MNPSESAVSTIYAARRIAQSEFVPIRHQNYHVRVWGSPQADTPPLVLVHGWMDVAASWQFLVDALSDDFAKRWIIAPDWRGYGLSTGAPVDNYWNHDYLADLDGLLDHYSPDRPVDLVGHSMGGNVVMQYAGVRPARIRNLVNLEGFGGPEGNPANAPKRIAHWLDELKQLAKGELDLRPYDSVHGVARRLMKTNPRLARTPESRGRALWLAHHWAAEKSSGQWDVLGDAAHKVSGPLQTREAEVLALYQAIAAPVLFVQATDNAMRTWWGDRFTLDQFHARLDHVKRVQRHVLPDCGHMLHHDQPALLAGLIEEFCQID
jgi:pimeloyl-ACP methyl ester carboxylesterase